jgi:hypothetical protein
MTDHHDFGDHYDDDPLPFDEHGLHDTDPGFGDPAPEPDLLPWGHDDPPPDVHHDLPPEVHHEDGLPDAPADQPDLAELPDLGQVDDGVDVFPPSVDVGDLPEPVDGFPWVDSGSLGLADIAAALHQSPTTPVQAEELAEYAGVELAPGADPWAVLADSDDPATSALARWWSAPSG